jgi:hypothetical protein
MKSTHAQLEKFRASVPSLFAASPSPKMSERYAFVSTAELLAPLLDKGGYEVTAANQRATRRSGRDPRFTRHMVRVRPATAKPMVGDVLPEVVITNSHDGQSRFGVYGGLFRLVCSNGLVIGVPGASAHGSFIHLGDPSKIIDAAKKAIGLAERSIETVRAMMKKNLNAKAQVKFATVAATIAYGQEDVGRFSPELLLAARRDEDKGDNVWVLFNRIQENIVRGGVKFVSANGSNRSFQTRGLTHIGRTMDFNIDLWNAAEKLVA